MDLLRRKAVDGLQLELRETIARLEALETTQESLVGPADLHHKWAAIQSSIEALERLQAILGARLDAVEAQRKEITLAVAEGIENVARAERRVKSTIQRAREELKKRGIKHDGLEAEGGEIRLVDADRGDKGGLSEVPTAVGMGRAKVVNWLKTRGLSK